MMRREDYKAVKRMDKQALTEYLQRVYRRGYEAGVKAMSEQMKKPADGEAPNSNGAKSNGEGKSDAGN